MNVAIIENVVRRLTLKLIEVFNLQMVQHLPDLVTFFVSFLPLCNLAPTTELSLPVEKVRMSARNVLLTANEMRISDKTILAKNLTLRADEISLTTLLSGMHLCSVFVSLSFYA